MVLLIVFFLAYLSGYCFANGSLCSENRPYETLSKSEWSSLRTSLALNLIRNEKIQRRDGLLYHDRLSGSFWRRQSNGPGEIGMQPMRM